MLYEVQQNGKSNEWYTPLTVIKAVRDVLGSIELDPASCEVANRTVGALRYFTKEDNGLQQAWLARTLFVNPPYSYEGTKRGMEFGKRQVSIMKLWIEKLIAEYGAGNVIEAILLTKADPKQVWFRLLWDYTICFSQERIFFNRPERKPETHQFGTVFVYFGQNCQKFVDVFTTFGIVVTTNGVHRQQDTEGKKFVIM